MKKFRSLFRLGVISSLVLLLLFSGCQDNGLIEVQELAPLASFDAVPTQGQ